MTILPKDASLVSEWSFAMDSGVAAMARSRLPLTPSVLSPAAMHILDGGLPATSADSALPDGWTFGENGWTTELMSLDPQESQTRDRQGGGNIGAPARHAPNNLFARLVAPGITHGVPIEDTSRR